MKNIFDEIGLAYYFNKTITNKGHKFSMIRLHGNNAKLFGDYIYEGIEEDGIGLIRKYKKYLLIKKSVDSGFIHGARNYDLIEKQKEMSIKLHNEGYLMSEILKITGIPSGNFYRLIKKEGLSIRNTKTVRAEKIKLASDLFKDGFNEKDISNKLKIGIRTIRIYLNEI